MVPHIDGQLCVNENSSHVTAALQALLHCESLMMVIREDTEHRKSCSTLFKCMICSLAKLCANFKSCGIANPKTLITRWNVASALMDDASKENPFEVLKVFIDLLCLEYAQRNPMFTIVDLRESVVSQIWHNVFTLDVSCEFCGQYEIKNYKSFIDLSKEPVTNLEVSLSNQFLAETESRCMKCLHMSGCTPVDICFSDCLIVHVQRCSSEFVLNFHMEVLGVKWSFKSVIVKQFKPAHPPFTIASCPDKYFRRFDDTKVTKVSPVGLSVADFLYQSSLTFIYEKTKQQPAAEKQGSSNKQLKICQTELSQEEVCSGGLSRKDASTQTSVNTVGVGVQTLRYYCYETCKQREKFKFFTGLETEEFQALFKLIGGDEVIGRLKRKYSLNSPQKIQPQKLSSEDKLFMFLLRLRRGIPLEELSEAFQMSISSVGEICYMMTRVIYLTLKGIEEKMFPSAREQRKYKPPMMKPFKNLRIILDGASFFLQSPSNFEQQGNTYSQYKSHSVVVFSVGIACNGATIFCSQGMEGSMSDKKVIVESGLLNRLTKGDGVMSDRGYELTSELQAIGCDFFKPPSLGKRECFTKEEEILTKSIASARIYTEHAIADIKDNRLLQGVIPLTLLPVLSDLVYIAAYLRNFSPSRIKNKTFVRCVKDDGVNQGRSKEDKNEMKREMNELNSDDESLFF